MKKRIWYLLTSVQLLISATLFAQLQLGPAKQWNKRFGGSDNEGSNADRKVVAIQTFDGGFLIGGSSNSNASGDKTRNNKGDYDYWIVKTDRNGVKEWDSTYGGPQTDILTCIQQTSDSGYILGGYSDSYHGHDKSDDPRGGNDYWILKTNINGTKQWDRTLGGGSTDQLWSIQQTTDGGYILGGTSNSNGGAATDKLENSWGYTDYWIIKTNSLGIKSWDKTFGGSAFDELSSVIQTTDGDYLIGGSSQSDINIAGGKTQINQGGYDMWVLRTDGFGNILWDNAYGNQNNNFLSSLQQTIPDEGFILGGYTSYGYWIVKIQPNGTFDWEGAYKGQLLGTGGGDVLKDIQQTADGGYILCGYSSTSAGVDKSQSTQGGDDFWILKTGTQGLYVSDRDFGAENEDIPFSIQQTVDGGYIIAGVTSSPMDGDISDTSRGGWDYWIVKTQPDCISPQKFFRDYDGDGYGNPLDTISSCSPLTGFVSNNSDCNDSNENIRPGTVEICNNIDDDCDGQIDEGISPTAEICDGIDNDCDGLVDENTAPARPGLISGPKYNVCDNIFTYSINPVPNATEYFWIVPPGFVIVQNNATSIQVLPPSSNVSGQIRVAAGNDCGTSTQRSLLVYTVAPNPSSAINGFSNVNAGQQGVTYQLPKATGVMYTWSVPSGSAIVSGQGTFKITVNFGGTSGYVNVTVSNACGTAPQGRRFVTVNPAFSSNVSKQPIEVKIEEDFKIYPNPTHGKITVGYNSKNSGLLQLKVFDITGKQVFSKQEAAAKGNNNYQLNLSHLPSGIYNLQLTNGNLPRRVKFVIEK